MFVDVEIPITMPPSLHVPADAVLDEGTMAIVYVDAGNGAFEPRRVQTGWRLGRQVEIKEELEPPSQQPTGAPPAAAPAALDGSTGANDFGQSEAAALKAREQSIQKEFEALKAEQNELIRLKEAADTPDKIENYHRKMERFLERSDAFHERRKAFEKEAREYNEKVRQNIEQTLKTLEAGEKQK